MLGVLGEKYTDIILEACVSEPLSVKEISNEFDVPVTTAYRRVEELEEHNLLDEKSEVQIDGNHHKTYRTNLDRLLVEMRESGMKIRIRYRDNPEEKLGAFLDEMKQKSLGGRGTDAAQHG
ncbi:MAG: winged helix-turn-helix domain-containing protein [Halobacteria archaeon]|nr:winged helix-turn-helix domain-containing protein [Halobacteria archaeon]